MTLQLAALLAATIAGCQHSALTACDAGHEPCDHECVVSCDAATDPSRCGCPLGLDTSAHPIGNFGGQW